MKRIAIVGALACLASACATPATSSEPAPGIEIVTEDVARFYELYEATGGKPTAEQIQTDYLDRGSEGLRHLTQVRNVNAENIARALETRPELYTKARTCLAALPRIRSELEDSFDNLLEIYPAAARPPVTILISRGKPFAIAGKGDGVQVALEGMCSDIADKFIGGTVDDRFVSVIAHEYIHVQQPGDFTEPTVLQRAIGEGVAEFVGELVSGKLANAKMHAAAKGRELEIETRFAADLDKTDLSAWFDNTTEDDPGQLGYWVGYRIAKAYYRNAPDKRAAIRELIEAPDAHALLEKSGWHPGIVLD
jgi:hypothetical protein